MRIGVYQVMNLTKIKGYLLTGTAGIAVAPMMIGLTGASVANAADLPALIDINEKSFSDYFGRYHADPQMPAGTATRVYTEWVRSAFQGWADWVLVAELDARIAAYGIWRKALAAEERNCLRVAHYDLAAIDPEFRGRGLWTALMLDGMWIARDLAQYLVGPVHVSNYPVQHLLQKFGWSISASRHSFHKWLNP